MLCLLKDKENIIDVIGFTLAPYSITLEFAPYGDLNSFLKSEHSKDITLKDKCTIGANIASALRVLHSFQPKIIHRDVKSLNILVCSINPICVKLSDFETSCFCPIFVSGQSPIDNPKWV